MTQASNRYGLAAQVAGLLAALLLLTSTAGAEPPREGVDRWDPYWVERDAWGPDPMAPGMQMRMVRHWTFMHRGVPEEYRGVENPFPGSAETVEAGQGLYDRHCVSCHGPGGRGDGEAANSLNPSPALLAYLIQMPMTVDSYLLWTVSVVTPKRWRRTGSTKTVPASSCAWVTGARSMRQMGQVSGSSDFTDGCMGQV